MAATTRMIIWSRSCDADIDTNADDSVTGDDVISVTCVDVITRHVVTVATFFKNDYVVKTRNPERFLKLGMKAFVKICWSCRLNKKLIFSSMKIVA